MTNASSHQRRYWYNQLVVRAGGEYCWRCGAPATPFRRLVLDRIDNSGNHSITHSKLEDFQILCYPCNHLKNRKGTKDTLLNVNDRPATREKIDRGLFEPAYNRNLRKLLLDREHACMKEVEMAATTLSRGGSIPTCKRYLDAKIHTTTNDKGIYQLFDFQCDSPHCVGVHICLVGMRPEKLIEMEIDQLRQDWEREYNSKRDTWKNHTATNLQPFVEFNEYIITHGLLVNRQWI